MDNWDEVRTAFQVARMGTVSGAADVLGVHHATVIRHIDALEGQLGVKLFQRHARGYTPTEAGKDLLQVAQTTEDQFNQLSGRIKGRGEGVNGELVVTSLSAFSNFVTPTLTDFLAENPSVRMRFLSGERLFRLEYGEAHVAIRAGKVPDQPDNVVQPLVSIPFSMVASTAYIEKHGMPSSVEDLKNHTFVAHDNLDKRPPFYGWLIEQVPVDQFIFRTSDERSMADAVLAGAGIGFVANLILEQTPDLHEVFPSQPDWIVDLWLVTHVDLHRTPKVQAILKFLKERAKDWS